MKFRPKWEYIASQLKGRTNLAKIDILNDGISTGLRFDITQVPSFVLWVFLYILLKVSLVYFFSDLVSVKERCTTMISLIWKAKLFKILPVVGLKMLLQRMYQSPKVLCKSHFLLVFFQAFYWFLYLLFKFNWSLATNWLTEPYLP